jgi:tRNA(Ile)-lysidine synthase
MYLLEQLRTLAPDYGFALHCAHFDHRLRGAESYRDRAFVADWCKKREIPCHIGSADVAAYAAEKRLGIEAAARELRYAFLEETADALHAVRIATAHTADDNAETLLLNLARGSGLKGLCGIPPVRGRIVRPLLETGSDEVLRWLEENGIPHIEDSTNAEDAHARNRVRRHIMPELKSLNSGFSENLIRCQSLLREDEAYLDTLAEDFYDRNVLNGRVSAAAFAALPAPIAARVLARILPDGLSRTHIEAVRRIAASSKKHALADLPGLRAARDYDSLVFGAGPRQILPKRALVPGELTPLPEAGLEIFCELIAECEEIHNSFNTFSFQSDSIRGKIFVKSRAEGDKIRLAGRNCTKTLKKLFSETGRNGSQAPPVPVFYDSAGVIAVYGFGIAERCAPEGRGSVLRLTVRPLRAVG